jgi:hypothetical protein
MNIYPLNSTQEDMLRESNMETMENGFQVTPYFEIPAERLSADDMAAACQKFLDTNHYAHVHLVRQEDGQFMISESMDMPNNVHRYKMTHSEWEQRQNEFARPFKLLEEPGVRVNVIETEQQTITCFSYCHIFFDGISMKLFVSGISNILNGIPIEDQDDIAAVWNREEIASYESEAYQRAKQVVCEKFKGHKYTDICRQTDNPWGQTLYACYLLDYNRMKHIRLNAGAMSEEQQHTMMTTICVAAYAMALGQMAGTTDVVFMTTNHGRLDKRLRGNVMGCFLKSLSLRIDVNPEQSVAELISQTRTTLFGTMRTLIYPWLHQMRDLQVPPEEQVGTEMNVSGTGIYEYVDIHGIDYPCAHIEMPESEAHLFLVVQIREEGLTFNVEGSEALYTQEQLDTMARLSAEYTLWLIGDQSKKLKEIRIKE